MLWIRNTSSGNRVDSRNDKGPRGKCYEAIGASHRTRRECLVGEFGAGNPGAGEEEFQLIRKNCVMMDGIAQ
jgi:hypothetical protein